MYNNSISRIALLWFNEWRKRAVYIFGFTAFAMLMMFGTILISAQRLELAAAFFAIHFSLGILITIGIQIAMLFPEWRNPFHSSQYIQIPATALEKYISRLSFPFIIAPAVYIIAFLLCRPLCLQFSLVVKDFMPYPMYGSDLKGLSLGATIIITSFYTLFVPGSLFFKRVHLLKSLAIYFAISLMIGLLSAALELPFYKTTPFENDSIGRMFAAQIQGIAMITSEHNLVLAFIIAPLMLILGFYLFKFREV